MPKRITTRPKKKIETSHVSRLFSLVAVFALSFGLLIFTLSFNRSSDLSKEDVCCGIHNFSYTLDPKDNVAYFNGKKLSAPTSIPAKLAKSDTGGVLGITSGEERWIEIDISDQKIIAREGDSVFLESAISSGLPGTPTPFGEFRIWYKTKSQKMSGGTGKNYYYLPNVPYIMFFENEDVIGYRGYSLHGTYWHDDFGNRRSHGCVNLPTPIAEQLYYWTQPVLSEGQKIVRATDANPGTRIVIHE